MKQQPSNFQQYQQNQLQTQQNLAQKQIQREAANAEPIAQNKSKETSKADIECRAKLKIGLIVPTVGKSGLAGFYGGS